MEASDSMVRMVIMLVIYFIIIYIIKLEINHLITTYSLLPCPRHNTTITAIIPRKTSIIRIMINRSVMKFLVK